MGIFIQFEDKKNIGIAVLWQKMGQGWVFIVEMDNPSFQDMEWLIGQNLGKKRG
jgi:hypothetical protein